MEKAALLSYIDLIMSNEDVVNAKPDPEIYLRAMERLSLEASECLICEDNMNGIKAALASGGHLLKIQDPLDVNYVNIYQKIAEIEERIR